MGLFIQRSRLCVLLMLSAIYYLLHSSISHHLAAVSGGQHPVFARLVPSPVASYT